MLNHRSRGAANRGSVNMKMNLSELLEDRLVVEPVDLLEALVAEYEERNDEAMLCALDTALCLAQAKAGGNGSTRRSHNANWNATPEHRLLKCVLAVLIRKGMAKNELLEKFKYLIPDYQTFFEHPVSDSALYGRADAGRRGGKYRAENPDIHSLTQPYWPAAQLIVEA